jgi:hypothetical protein
MRRSRVPSIAPGAFFVAQSWADCITNMAGFDLRQAQLRVTVVSTISSQPPMIADELRRQADVFTDLVELRSKLGRHPSARPRDAQRRPAEYDRSAALGSSYWALKSPAQRCLYEPCQGSRSPTNKSRDVSAHRHAAGTEPPRRARVLGPERPGLGTSEAGEGSMTRGLK